MKNETPFHNYASEVCSFDKGNCGTSYVREEELEKQFDGILKDLSFSPEVFEWMREALRQSPQEKAEYNKWAIERLNAQCAKLQNRINQIYLDKLDGEIEEGFYKKHVSLCRKEQVEACQEVGGLSGPFRVREN